MPATPPRPRTLDGPNGNATGHPGGTTRTDDAGGGAIRRTATPRDGTGAAQAGAGAAQAGAAAAQAGAGAPLVRVRDASVAQGRRTVWSHVDATVDAGEFVAVLGPNGVGKSTLLKAILGLVPLAGGTVRLLGRPPGQANHLVGYLPQRRNFDTSLRVRGTDVVRLGLDGDRWGVPLPGRRSRAAARRVRELVDLVGAGGYADRPIGAMSGGEQQRLLIAQALARGPRLLMLDEPLDSLDLPNQAAVAALISRICRSENVAVMMVAHDVNPILTYLDRVIYLGHGGAVGGTPTEVINAETLSALYGTPIEVLTTSDGRLVVVGQPEAPAHHSDRHPGGDAGHGLPHGHGGHGLGGSHGHGSSHGHGGPR